jgi:DNA repair protein RecO (recombination protein O)
MPKAERMLRVEAIVLHHVNWGEADRLLTVFTRTHGKLRVIAKSVRKMQSRKAGHLEPFSHSTLMLAKAHDLWIVTDAETIDAFSPLREDLRLMTHASYVIELIDRFTFEEGQNWQLYQLTVDSLKRLCEQKDPFVPLRYFEMRLLDLMGFRPLLFECAKCGKEIQAEDQFFSSEQGGALCPGCGARSGDARLVSLDALRFMRHFQRSDYNTALKADPSPKVKAEIEALMNAYLVYHLERGLNTPEFLKQIQN